MEKLKMNTKTMLVSFLAIACVFALVATVSAYNVYGDLANDINVKVDGIYVEDAVPSVVAGETIDVKVYFTSLIGDADDDSDDSEGTDVRMKAEIEGEKVDVSARTSTFDVEEGNRYSKTLSLKVPYELKDESSDDLELTIKIWNGDYETEIEDITLNVQRPSYNADIKSVSVTNNVEAGETFPVDIVVKNRGYNDLDDVYVTVAIPALNLHRSAYLGDLVVEEDEDDDDDTDTVNGRLYLEVPYGVEAGLYALEVEVSNEDTVSNAVTQIVVENDFTSSIVPTTLRKTANTGEEVTYELLVVNPTNKLVVYRIVSASSDDVLTVVNPAVVAVPAGSSGSVKVTASSDVEGEYSFNVDVISGESIVDTMAFNLDVEGQKTTTTATSPIVVLTIVLAIIFVVLLVVLIVLLGKKPEKQEEFGESYY